MQIGASWYITMGYRYQYAPLIGYKHVLCYWDISTVQRFPPCPYTFCWASIIVHFGMQVPYAAQRTHQHELILLQKDPDILLKCARMGGRRWYEDHAKTSITLHDSLILLYNPNSAARMSLYVQVWFRHSIWQISDLQIRVAALTDKKVYTSQQNLILLCLHKS